MIKAIFFDMDETLCGTSQADQVAGQELAVWLTQQYPQLADATALVKRYLSGVYKQLNHEYPQLVALLPNESAFRCGLLQTLLKEQDVEISLEQAQSAQNYFDKQRMQAFTFFPGVDQLLKSLRGEYKLVVITNGPAFSQHPKLQATQMSEWVDHIIVGGDEPEEKPAISIFEKALRLADVTAEQVIHIGDSLPADIAGANNAGIKSVWVNASGKENTSDIQPSFTVTKTVELDGILKQLTA